MLPTVPAMGMRIGVAVVHGGELVFVHPGLGAVVIHADFLRDDAAFLFHALLGEIRRGDEREQNLKILFKIFGAVEMVGGHAVAGKGVGIAARFCELLHGVVLRQVEHFMLQIVRRAVR